MDRPKRYKPNRIAGATKFSLTKVAERQHYVAMYKTPEWTNYRMRFLKQNPKCYACGERAGIVDHIDPHKGDKNKFEDIRNHMPLCKPHHDYVTANFDRYVPPKTENKLRWLAAFRNLKGVEALRVRVLPNYN